LVPLGRASLVLGGEEEGDIPMNIPAKPLKVRRSSGHGSSQAKCSQKTTSMIVFTK
jgi:hypothetical protein